MTNQHNPTMRQLAAVYLLIALAHLLLGGPLIVTVWM
jgi:hypothetical protein